VLAWLTRRKSQYCHCNKFSAGVVRALKCACRTRAVSEWSDGKDGSALASSRADPQSCFEWEVGLQPTWT
jgi:hypothetical protein